MTDLRDACVVITGASSGIGRATALAFASHGAKVVLAARREVLLQEAARECREEGGEAIAIPTDVTDADAVLDLARRARDEFGRIDTWINNAGVGLFGPFVEGDVAEHRRVVETNLFGAMNGAAAALPIFLEQGHGTLINTISLGGWAPVPMGAAYAASKFGLRGFTASLRQEFREHPGIAICAVFPSVTDTPGHRHGANLSGRVLEPPRPIYAPEEVAAVMLDVAQRPRDEVAVGLPSRLAWLGYAVAPWMTEHMTGWATKRYLSTLPRSSRTLGNLFEPMQDGRDSRDGWQSRKGSGSRQVTLAGTVLAGVAVAATAATLTSLARRNGRRGG